MSNFQTALMQANLLYGVEMSFDDFVEIGLNAWNFIGNKPTRLYRYRARVDSDDLSVQLPCNADIIESVTLDVQDWDYTPNEGVSRYNIEADIERQKIDSHPLYSSGKYAKYSRVGDTLYFDKNYGNVNILYKGIVLDDEGLPELSDKEVIAVATYVAYIQKYKQGLVTNNANIIQVANLLKNDWLRYCDAARVPTSISQNDMNEILEVKNSWDRKMYNKSYRPLK